MPWKHAQARENIHDADRNIDQNRIKCHNLNVKKLDTALEKNCTSMAKKQSRSLNTSYEIQRLETCNLEQKKDHFFQCHFVTFS